MKSLSPAVGGEGTGEGALADAEPSAFDAGPPFSPEPEPGSDTIDSASAGDTVEVTPEELAADLVNRLAALNQDLALAFDAWDDLPLDGRRQLLEGARWLAALVPYLEARE